MITKQDSAQIQILTLPFNGNVGGMLQAYALQKAVTSIKQASCRVCINKTRTRERYILWFLIQSCMVFAYLLCFRWLKAKNKFNFLRLTSRLRAWNKILPTICSSCSKITQGHAVPNASVRYIVGSDQVWRASYSTGVRTVSTYFLNFVQESTRSQSIAYAASFGTDLWEGNALETKECAKLLQSFKAVSVREKSAIQICREQFGVDAIRMPDPTMLLSAVDYDNLIVKRHKMPSKDNFIASYILDESNEMTARVINYFQAQKMHIRQLHKHDSVPLKLSCSISEWLSSIRDAQYVITDSFHGCVFSIIYNKEFICFGNIKRGSARFDTLMQVFHLEDRFVMSAEQIDDVLRRPINWSKVNSILDEERKRGLTFLKRNL